MSSCSMRYLLMLLLELKKARSFSLVSSCGASDHEKQLDRLKYLTREISRLLQQPCIFPSDTVKARFFAVLGVDAELQFSQACKALLLKRELRNLERRHRAHVTRTTYVEGACGWDNFLFNGAPGSGFTSHRTNPETIFQVVPAVGIRILADWDREEADIVRFVREVGRPAVPRAPTCKAH